jgi:dihydrofolate synthase / folylpolyglutamate synthase
MSLAPGYEELLSRLFAARRFGVRLELDRIRGCLERLGRPQDRIGPIVQVGGTNGKGSTAVFVETMLRSAGIRTGLFTSPHLSRFAERFAVGGEPAPEAEIARAGAAVEAADPEGTLTFFERACAIALWLFERAGVETCVLEVGLGGRFDATSAVDAEVAVVTGVDLDHQEYLGDTVEAIAGEKAGIFRAGRRAVIGAAGLPEARPVLVAAARRAGVRALAVVGEEELAAVPEPLGLAGSHQRANAAAALLALDALEAAGGPAVDAPSRESGLASARLPGRLEIVGGQVPVILDGAHNPGGARALAGALRDGIGGDRPLTLVLGLSVDKDARAIAAPLCEVARAVVATQAGNERALAAVELAGAIRAVAPGLEIAAAPSTAAALELARTLAGGAGRIAVAGSLFLVGEAREILLGVGRDRLLLVDPLGTGKVC